MNAFVRPTIGAALRNYQLPKDILCLAPNRRPFEQFSASALTAAASWVRTFPEKRGILSHAVRSLSDCKPSIHPDAVLTFEAHIDGKDLPTHVEMRLLAAGFEPDGFVRFNPADFNAHFTLKYKVDRTKQQRCQELLSMLRTACVSAHAMLCEAGVEAYVELEIYPDGNRRIWPERGEAEFRAQDFPLREGSLRAVLPPCGLIDGPPAATDIDCTKRADIHVKVGSTTQMTPAKRDVLYLLCSAGFYPVLTWSGNNICTAQFRRPSDAVRVFEALEAFFGRYPVVREMTLESSPATWRTHLGIPTRLAAIPPVIVALDGISHDSAPSDSNLMKRYEPAVSLESSST